MPNSSLPEPLTIRRSLWGGHLDPRTVQNLLTAALDIYDRTRAFSFAGDVPDEAKELVVAMRQELLIFRWFRDFRRETGATVSNAPDVAEAVFQWLSRSPLRQQIFRAACHDITTMNRTSQHIWTRAMNHGKGTEKRQAVKGACFFLRQKLLQLIGTGVTRDMPNSSFNCSLSPERRLHIAGVFQDRYEWCLRTATERGQFPWISALMGRATGLPMFNLVRDQVHGQCEIGTEGLALALDSLSTRARRGFWAEFGRSIFELHQIAAELLHYGKRAGTGTPVGRRFLNTRLVVLISMFQAIDTGGLQAVA